MAAAPPALHFRQSQKAKEKQIAREIGLRISTASTEGSVLCLLMEPAVVVLRRSLPWLSGLKAHIVAICIPIIN